MTAERKTKKRSGAPVRPGAHRAAPAASRRQPERARRVRAADVGSGVAPGMQAINTYLAVANVRASMRFLEQALRSRRRRAAGHGGQPRYAEMRNGELVMMLVRKGDDTAPGGGAAALYTYVADVDAALAAGPATPAPGAAARRTRLGRPRRGGHRPRRLPLGAGHVQEARAVLGAPTTD